MTAYEYEQDKYDGHINPNTIEKISKNTSYYDHNTIKKINKNISNNIKQNKLIKSNYTPEYIYTICPHARVYGKRPSAVRKRDRLIEVHNSHLRLGIKMKPILKKGTFDDIFIYNTNSDYHPRTFETDFYLLQKLHAEYHVSLLTGHLDYFTNYYPKLITNKIDISKMLKLPMGCLLFTSLDDRKYYFAYPIDINDLFNDLICHNYEFTHIPIINTTMTNIKKYLQNSDIIHFKDYPAYNGYFTLDPDCNKNYATNLLSYAQYGFGSSDYDHYYDYLNNLLKTFITRGSSFKINSQGYYNLDLPNELLNNPFWQKISKLNLLLTPNVKMVYKSADMQLNRYLKYYDIRLHCYKFYKTGFFDAVDYSDVKKLNKSNKPGYKPNQNFDLTFTPADYYQPIVKQQGLAKLFTILGDNQDHTYFVENNKITSYSGTSKLSRVDVLELDQKQGDD